MIDISFKLLKKLNFNENTSFCKYLFTQEINNINPILIYASKDLNLTEQPQLSNDILLWKAVINDSGGFTTMGETCNFAQKTCVY